MAANCPHTLEYCCIIFPPLKTNKSNSVKTSYGDFYFGPLYWSITCQVTTFSVSRWLWATFHSWTSDPHLEKLLASLRFPTWQLTILWLKRSHPLTAWPVTVTLCVVPYLKMREHSYWSVAGHVTLLYCELLVAGKLSWRRGSLCNLSMVRRFHLFRTALMEAHSPKTKENPLAALVSTNTFFTVTFIGNAVSIA